MQQNSDYASANVNGGGSPLPSNFSSLPEAVAVAPDNTVPINQPDVIVSGAGTEAANGTYTYRGIFNGKPFYNLEGEASSGTASCIVWNNPEWDINDSLGALLYYNDTNNQDTPYAEGTWLTADGDSPAPTVTESITAKTATAAQLVAQASARQYVALSAGNHNLTAADAVGKIYTNEGAGGSLAAILDPTDCVEGQTQFSFVVADAAVLEVRRSGGGQLLDADAGAVTALMSSTLYARLTVRFAGTAFGGTNDWEVIGNRLFVA